MHCMLCLCAALLTVAPDQAAELNAADLARMQGDWMATVVKINGIKHPEETVQSMYRTIEKDHYAVFRYTREIASGTFKLDATQTPHTIDSTPANSPDGVPLLGIYEFDGEKMRVCNALPGKPRPKDFEARLGSQQTLIEWVPEEN